jgi:hypothetical protein
MNAVAELPVRSASTKNPKLLPFGVKATGMAPKQHIWSLRLVNIERKRIKEANPKLFMGERTVAAQRYENWMSMLV